MWVPQWFHMGGFHCVPAGSVQGLTTHQAVNTSVPAPGGHDGILYAVPWKCQGHSQGHEAREQYMTESLMPGYVPAASWLCSDLGEHRMLGKE